MDPFKWLKSMVCSSSRDDLEKCREKVEKQEKTIAELNLKLDKWVRGRLTINPVKKDLSWAKEQIHKKYPDAEVISLDRTGLFVSKEDAKKIVKEDLVSTLKYLKSVWDCENYAYAVAILLKLKYGIDLGIVEDYDSYHAYNIWVYINSDDDVEVMEPQSDQFSPGSDHYTPNTRTRIRFF